MFSRWEGPYSNWELDFKQCSFDRTVRILHHLPFNIFRISMLFTHALVPSAFRLQVSAMIQESPSKFFLTASGILKPRHAAHRSKTPTAGVVTRPAFQEAWQIVSQWREDLPELLPTRCMRHPAIGILFLIFRGSHGFARSLDASTDQGCRRE